MGRRHESGNSPRRRSGAGGRPARRLHVFTEGSDTERIYLDHWHRLHRASVTVTVDDRHGTPATIVGHAVQQQKADKRRAKREGSPADEYWCVFDCDEHPLLKESIQRAEDNGVRVAFSNPCLELWFVLHDTDWHQWVDRHTIQSASEAAFGFRKRPTPEALTRLSDSFTVAKSRARALDELHVHNGSWRMENPSSTMWMLIDSIRQ